MATIYRKYRPQIFDDVFGQDHVLDTLKKALKLGRVAHAYLFTGSRGIGKTTVARLLAKAVNCLDANQRPCGKCSNCRAIAENRFVDLIEIDAASNRGIDEIRQLRDKIQFAPSLGQKRVYIIDEVHMLTREAFNALLKTLEEPPEHTIFIFATTEIHKVPVTVLSRCQRFDFRLADDDLIAHSLKKIAKKEGFKIEQNIIELLVRCSAGSFRDAQSLLDQLSSHLEDGDLQYEQALKILNLTSLEEIEDFIKILQANNAKEAISFIAALKEKGTSFPDFLSQLIFEIRRLLIDKIKNSQNGDWENHVLKKLIEAESQMKFSPIESLPLEIVVYELCLVPSQISKINIDDKDQVFVTPKNRKMQNDNLKSKIKNTRTGESDSEKLENKSISQSIENTVGGRNANLIQKERHDQLKIKNKSALPITNDIKHAVVADISQKNKSLGALLNDLGWEGDSGEVKIIAQYDFHKKKIMDKKNLVLLENSLQSVLQCKSKVSCELLKEESIAEELDEVFG